MKKGYDFILPIGPYHPSLHEPEYFKLYVKGEEIVDVDLYFGYNHRGVEKIIENDNWYTAIFAAERMCGICGTVHTTSYCKAVETIQELEVPMRAQWIRTIMLEFERVQSHLLWLGLTGHQLGFETMFMHCLGIRERLLDLTELITGNRIHYGINTIGGVRRDILPSHVEKIKQTMKSLKEESGKTAQVFLNDRIIGDRLRGIGMLDKKTAVEKGVVGPVARATGLDIDARNTGFYAYKEAGFKPVVRQGRDCFARMEVRLEELMQSMSMIENCADKMPAGEFKPKGRLMIIEPGQSIGRVEAPRGELTHYVVSNGDINPLRDRIRTPTYANFNALKRMLVGYTIADAPVIIASIDPCMSCTDRVLVVDEGTGKQKVLDLEEEMRKCKRNP